MKTLAEITESLNNNLTDLERELNSGQGSGLYLGMLLAALKENIVDVEGYVPSPQEMARYAAALAAPLSWEAQAEVDEIVTLAEVTPARMSMKYLYQDVKNVEDAYLGAWTYTEPGEVDRAMGRALSALGALLHKKGHISKMKARALKENANE